MKRLFCVLMMVATAVSSFAVTAEEIIARVDKNEIYDSIRYDGEMEIHLSGKVYVKELYALAKGDDNSFMEFTNSDDYGTKYMKKDGKLFVYSPDTEEIMPITGHMLKESIMGSDMSYEDTINNEGLLERYTPTIIGEDTVLGKKTWKVELKAKSKLEAYSKQILWVEQETFSTLKTEMFALSGVKLKTLENVEIEKIRGKYFPTVSKMVDLLRKDSKTIMRMKNVELDLNVPDSTFSFRNLER